MNLPLADRLRDATRPLHVEVERAGIMVPLLRGQVSRAAYAALLRNLHAIYDELESGLRQHAAHPGIAPVFDPRLMRAEALTADLEHLHGPRWKGELPLAPAGEAYARHLRELASARPATLAAHVYVRYLGDLSGGQVLKRVVRDCFGLAPGHATAFYEFGPAADVRTLAQDLRRGLDRLAADDSAAQAIVDEACAAFRRHKDLFMQLEPPSP